MNYKIGPISLHIDPGKKFLLQHFLYNKLNKDGYNQAFRDLFHNQNIFDVLFYETNESSFF